MFAYCNQLHATINSASLAGFHARIRFLLQQSLILKNKGIKIGFLGYCDVPSCLTLRKKYKTGPAVYTDPIAQRDVRRLKVRTFVSNNQMWTFYMIGLLKRKWSMFTIRYFIETVYCVIVKACSIGVEFILLVYIFKT